ncbi:relaxase/mobilization nuclease domain-containing protein [Bosea sp. (in: a-proteobacteria)]|uniref:relaxase/mobilization nuclease domain-containing protein n=1 Tax=Bosea sp. (in: a-proteobacteria) TaxID=1871050 RepID=UPI0027348D7E|nr:hypothetical protein [Bosea sp. (in: a-proteobacteria)]MDP3258665.1 hypothetical protein [Bosea sp. (in: a-proteobacteria)]
MIIRSRFTKDDPDRVRHLLDTSNNRRVVERHDLDRNSPVDLELALRGFSVTTALHKRASSTVAHFKMSPDIALGHEQLLHSLAVLEIENGIAPDHPRKIIEHDKGDRPPHYHILYSAVHPVTARALSSKDNYARDELVSRRLEIAFDTRIVPGPRVARNAADLRARNNIREALILEGYAPVRTASRDDDAARQQGSRTGLAPAKFRALLLKTWHAGLRLGSFPRALAKAGFSVAIGDRRATLMVVHDASGNSLPLEESLKRASKGTVQIGLEDLMALRRDAPTLRQAVQGGLDRAERKARQQIEREINRGLFEAAADGEVNAEFSRLKRERLDAQRAEMATARRTQAQQRRAIRAAFREADRVRRIRIDRAFRSARILQSRDLQKAALLLAAGGLLLTGVGLGLALGVGISIRVAMQIQARQSRQLATNLVAQRMAVRMPGERRKTTLVGSSVEEKAREGRASPGQHVQPDRHPTPLLEVPMEAKAAAFDFNTVPKAHRVLAAIAIRQLSGGRSEVPLGALETALGQDQLQRLKAFAETGTKAQKSALLSWDRQRSRDAFAAATILRRAGEADAAARVESTGRQREIRERRRDRERD